MSTGWENHEPSPIEFMHGRLMDEFHKWRKERTDEIIVPIDGSEFNKIVVAAKLATYEKYKVLGLDKAILKSDLKCGLLPSELLRQRDELRELLRRFKNTFSSDSFIWEDMFNEAEAAIKNTETK